MATATFTNVRSEFKKYCDVVCEDAEILTITRERGDNVVLMSEREWESMQETFFFTSDANRMERLAKSEEDLAAGRTHRFANVRELRARAAAHVEA